ncbi:MAG: mannose-1-phosphate guanylyltransferase/mannose-6-phosphate isomerase [Pseudomonadota bacterium]|nr:mannose-1-phosphate guanylyltransferase/mannose-6-phosphate isomerase [Pseudomonadota bacterium]
MKAKPVILSGGSGVRLWPISRKNLAKQFVDIFQKESSLFLDTFKRLSDKSFSSPIIISNLSQRFEILKLIKKYKLKTDKIILERLQKNTAPACVFASYFSDPEEILFIVPSDHYVENSKKFLSAVNHAIKIASDGYLVTIGAKAFEPNTNYGYITIEKKKKYLKGFEVKKFIEKPSKSHAIKLIKENAFWNTGIIVVKNRILTNLFKKYSKSLYENCVLSCKKSIKENEFYILDDKPIENLKPISVDYAILEKNFKKIILPFHGKWSDLGTFDSIYKLQKSFGNVLSIEAKNNFTYSDDKLLVIAGIKDQVIVNTKNAILVTTKESSNLLRKVMQLLERRNKPEAYDDSTISRPWGMFENIKQEEGFKIKKLLILPGEKISLQKHLRRSEHWVVISGIATITKGKKKFLLKPNESTFIKKGEVHRIENNSKKNLVLVEVQTGNYLEEDDILRLKDKYRR